MIEVCLGQPPTRQLRKQSVRFYICDHLPSTSPNLSRIHVLHQTSTWLQILSDFSWKPHDHTSSSSKLSLNAFHLCINERSMFDLASPLGKRFFQKDCVSRRRASETPTDPPWGLDGQRGSPKLCTSKMIINLLYCKYIYIYRERDYIVSLHTVICV